MKHCRPISGARPAPAQFEPILQLVGLKQALLGMPSILFGQAQQVVSLLTAWQSLQILKASQNT